MVATGNEYGGSASNWTNLFGIYTLLFSIAIVCSLLCDPAQSRRAPATDPATIPIRDIPKADVALSP